MFGKQCWWITGASSGIGEGLARALAARGASLILSGRNGAALEAVARDCADAYPLPFEATDFETGTEHDIAVLRRQDPEALFDRMSAIVRDGYARQMAAGPGKG